MKMYETIAFLSPIASVVSLLLGVYSFFTPGQTVVVSANTVSGSSSVIPNYVIGIFLIIIGAFMMVLWLRGKK